MMANHTVIKRKALLGMMLILMPLVGCNNSSRASGTENPVLEALKQETIENLVFVKGSTFMMGDVLKKGRLAISGKAEFKNLRVGPAQPYASK